MGEMKWYVVQAYSGYENKVKLLVTAAASPEELYEEGHGRFEFERTVSRLNEMQSADYLALGHGEA